VDTVARLAQVPNILAVKDSSGDLQNTCEYIRVVPERFSVLMGRDTLPLRLAATIVMEAAIRMAKVDPKTVPGA